MAEHANLEALALELNSVAIHLVRRLRQADASLGVTSARLSALSVLVFGGPRTITELADAEQVAGPTVSKLVVALEADGLVLKAPHATDNRSTVISATARGRRLMERGRRQRVERLVGELQHLDASDVSTLQRAAVVLRRLEQGGSPSP